MNFHIASTSITFGATTTALVPEQIIAPTRPTKAMPLSVPQLFP